MGSHSFAEMRRRNALKIVATVRESPNVSRADVARLTNLARATVSSIVDELIATGLLLETGSKDSAKGRRPIGLTFNTSAQYCAGICIEPDHIELVVTNLDGEVKHKLCYTEPLEHMTAEELAVRTAETLHSALEQWNLNLDKISAVGLGVPGPLRSEFSDREPEEKIVPIDYRIVRQALQDKLRKNVLLDSNLNMYAIAETHQGRLRGGSNGAFIVRVGHLVRSAFVVEKRIFEGNGKRAGEIGHLKVPGQGRPCFCGGLGCINAVASIPGLIQACSERHIDVKCPTELNKAVTSGNKQVIEILQNAGIAIGYGVAAAINLLAPDTVLIAGRSIIEHQFVRDEIMAAIQRHSLPPNLQHCEIILSSCEHRPEATGAAWKAIMNHEVLPALEESQLATVNPPPG